MFRIDGADPPTAEVAAYCGRLRDILDAGGAISLVQLHSVARKPDDDCVTALPDEHLDTLADIIRADTGGLVVETFYGSQEISGP
jgi:hypothetical protein